MAAKTVGTSSEEEGYQNQNMRFRMGLVRQIDAWAMGQTDEKGKALSRNAAVSVLCERALRGMASGSVAPAPAAMNAPTAEENAAAVVELLTKASLVSAAVTASPSSSPTVINDQGDKLKAIYAAVLTQTELVKDAIAARHIAHERRGIVTRLMGRTHAHVDGVAVVEEAYVVAKDKARRQMGLSQ